MEKRETFNHAAKVYDESRPSYPDEVIDWILQRVKVPAEEKLLEIGAGTGQATGRFVERGYHVHCVEMGQNLADILMQKYGHCNVSVDVSSFEAWAPPSAYKTSFIYSATAFHWIDPSIRYKKCYELLKEDGYLVLLWNVSPDVDIPEIKKSYELLWEYYPEKSKKPLSMDIKEMRKYDIQNSGLFVLEDYLDYKWKLRQSREDITKGFFSQSSFLALEESARNTLADKVEQLYKSLEDIVETDFYTTAYIAKKKL